MTEQITRLNWINPFFQSPHNNPVSHASELLLSGNYQACLKFIRSQPTFQVDTSAQMLVYQATAMLFSEYAREKILAVLAKAERLEDAEFLAGEIAAIRAIICSYTDDPEEGIKQSKIALQQINPDDTFFKHIIERNLGVSYTLRNDLENANYWFEKLLMSSCRLEDTGSVLAAYNYLTYIRKVQGRLREAEIIYQKALLFIADHNAEQMPHSIKIISGYGHLLLYWHRLDQAKTYFQKAILLAGQTDILYAYTAYQHLCETYIREQNLQAAQATLDELQQLVWGKEDLYERIHLQQTKRLDTRLSIEEGNIDLAFEWLISSKFNEVSPNDLFQHYGYELGLTLPIAARIFLLKGMTDRAIRTLRAVIPKLIHHGANSTLIRALSALAVAYEQRGDYPPAMNALTKAISLAEPENNLGDFLLMGRSLIPVLRLALQNDIGKNFSFKLLRILLQDPPHQMRQLYNSGKTSLSKREIDVLHLIAEGMTNRQIAEALFLSNNTIKSHSTNIYRKLNVENRTQAISKARTLGILYGKISGSFDMAA